MDAEAFWSLYEGALTSEGMTREAVDWAHKRAAYFVQSTARVRLSEKTEEDITKGVDGH